MSQDTEPEPVDAEFEPAPIDEPEAKKRGGRFLGGLFLFLIATLAGGALGVTGAMWLDGQRDAPAVGENSDALASVEARIAALETAEPVVSAPEGYAELQNRVTNLENAPPPMVGDADPEQTALLVSRIEALESAMPVAGEAIDLTAITNRLDRLADTAERAEALANQALDSGSLPVGEAGVDASLMQALADRIAALEETESASIAEPVDLSAIETRLAAVEGLAQSASMRADAAANVAGSAQSGTQDADTARILAARTLALMALADIAETSAPFEAERAALARLWRDRPELNAIQPVARAGVPDREALAADYPRADIEAAAGPSRAFFGLIEVRRVDPDEGADGPLALAALAAARLERGDLDGAVIATERLEGEALTAAQAWLLAARARLQIESTLTTLRAALVDEAASEGADPR